MRGGGLDKFKVILSVLTIVFFCSLAYSNDTNIQFTKKYQTSFGLVTFDHQSHAADRVNECAHCHSALKTFGGINKLFAHNYCKTCHKANEGPTTCEGCHDGTQITKQ